MSDQIEVTTDWVGLRELTARITALEAKQAEILAAITDFTNMAKPVVDEIVPTIDRIANVPVIRMALGLKKGETLSGKR